MISQLEYEKLLQYVAILEETNPYTLAIKKWTDSFATLSSRNSLINQLTRVSMNDIILTTVDYNSSDNWDTGVVTVTFDILLK